MKTDRVETICRELRRRTTDELLRKGIRYLPEAILAAAALRAALLSLRHPRATLP